MTTRSRLVLITYASALVSSDRRTLAVVHGMERALPGLRLEWRISEDGRPIALPQRDEWLAAETKDGGFPLLCNGDESHPVTVTGWEAPARLCAGDHAQFEVHAKLPLDEPVVAAAASVLEAVAEGTRAFWGHATPFSASVEISRQIVDPVRKPGIPPRGLPLLRLPEKSRTPEIPHRLGWLNYWSPAAAEALGFPDPSRDAELLSRARRTASGGWVVQLMDTPLDLDNPAHLDALKRAYERFPEVGGRAAPRALAASRAPPSRA